jgi:RNA polymerase sigma factor (sigma-70 family)
MLDEGSVTHWIHEVQDGNADAAQALWERYFERLVKLTRHQLRGSNRRLADEEDVAISVFDTFCRAAGQGRFANLADRDSLWRLLVTMAARKSIDLRRHQSRMRRGGGVVRGESAMGQTQDLDEPRAIAQVVGDSPTPEFSAMMAEQLQRLLALLEDKQLRELALGKMEGFTNEEMGQRLGCSVRTVERRLRLIRVKCEKQLMEE